MSNLYNSVVGSSQLLAKISGHESDTGSLLKYHFSASLDAIDRNLSAKCSINWTNRRVKGSGNVPSVSSQLLYITMKNKQPKKDFTCTINHLILDNPASFLGVDCSVAPFIGLCVPYRYVFIYCYRLATVNWLKSSRSGLSDLGLAWPLPWPFIGLVTSLHLCFYFLKVKGTSASQKFSLAQPWLGSASAPVLTWLGLHGPGPALA